MNFFPPSFLLWASLAAALARAQTLTCTGSAANDGKTTTHSVSGAVVVLTRVSGTTAAPAVVRIASRGGGSAQPPPIRTAFAAGATCATELPAAFAIGDITTGAAAAAQYGPVSAVATEVELVFTTAGTLAVLAVEPSAFWAGAEVRITKTAGTVHPATLGEAGNAPVDITGPTLFPVQVAAAAAGAVRDVEFKATASKSIMVSVGRAITAMT
jgi:hypothetical protein